MTILLMPTRNTTVVKEREKEKEVLVVRNTIILASLVVLEAHTSRPCSNIPPMFFFLSDVYDTTTYYDEYDRLCATILRGSWSYMTDLSFANIDIDGDLLASTGDMNVFDSGNVTVSDSMDGTFITSASISGTCTVSPDIAVTRDYCQLNFDFGNAGSVSVQGPLEKMTITGVTGCFYPYYGLVYGFSLPNEYGFTADVFMR